MAKGVVNLSILKTNDDKLLLQVQEPKPGVGMDNNVTVHEDVDSLLAGLKRKLNQQLP